MLGFEFKNFKREWAVELAAVEDKVLLGTFSETVKLQPQLQNLLQQKFLLRTWLQWRARAYQRRFLPMLVSRFQLAFQETKRITITEPTARTPETSSRIDLLLKSMPHLVVDLPLATCLVEAATSALWNCYVLFVQVPFLFGG